MIEIWCDGSSRGNPGLAGYSFVVKKDGIEIYQDSAMIGDTVTSNYAEYMAVMMALDYFKSMKYRGKCTIYTDSALVVGQLTKHWKVNVPALQALHDTCDALLTSKITLVQIPREENEEANKLSQWLTKEAKRQDGLSKMPRN
jgi:ribonuclease HI